MVACHTHRAEPGAGGRPARRDRTMISPGPTVDIKLFRGCRQISLEISNQCDLSRSVDQETATVGYDSLTASCAVSTPVKYV